MVTDEEVARINELYHKSKTPEGLTPEEKEEQMHLRGKYIASIRDNLTATLDNSSVVDEKGNKRKLRRKPNLKIVSDDEK
ncbi:MAG: DUF896 domain-containing protein [Acutalibacteraceae bacterium]|nr:DUF896 domain-containing protein [Acutalibacteraceae bacterium]